MTRMLCVVLIFGVATLPSFSIEAQDPFGAGTVVQEMPSILNRFSRAIMESDDTEKIKNELFETMVFELVRHGELGAVEALAKRGDKLVYRDPDENTLLHVAAAAGADTMVRFLVKHGLDVDVDNAAGHSPLSLAAQGNHIATAKLLLKSGADVNGNSQLSHPLNTAAWYGHLEMVNLLLVNRAHVNRRDADGNTALHKAVWQGHVEVVEKLLDYDADAQAENDARQTPQSLAMNRIKASIFGVDLKRRWGTEQVCGAPDAGGGDDPNAWASKTQDGQAEWLIVEFENAVEPATLEIYENLAPKAVNKITVFDSAGKEHEAWSGKDPARPGPNGVYIANIKLDTKIKTKKFRIHIDSVAVKNWNEIDAVRLHATNGKQQWVKSAQASSCYAGGIFIGHKFQVIHDLITKKD